jgi:hypothetical protein
MRQVWQAYAEVKTALEKRDFALPLLAAAEETYASTVESYRSTGLATVLDLLAAQRDLARARHTEIQSRADLLQSAAPWSTPPASDYESGRASDRKTNPSGVLASMRSMRSAPAV